MTPYRFRRRSFLAGLGGAFGLETMLKNLEASAAGVSPPPRLLVTHWPLGTLQTEFVPNGTGTTYVPSPLMQPFDDAGLRSEMIALYGLNPNGLTSQGGGSEAGTVFWTTGKSSPGTRQNGGESDDACAGGPSWDQIFLKNAPGLARRDASGAIVGRGVVGAICDSRVDSYETSTQTLSYLHATRYVNSANPGGIITENTPNMPTLSPALLYADLFSGFMPGGDQDAALRALRMRKSVLDSALRELEQLRTLAPADERVKIDAHAELIRQLERQLQQQIDAGTVATCALPAQPPASLVGKSSQRNSDFSNPIAPAGDNETHEAVGQAHLATIRTAFQCDLIRVATFQWVPGSSHVALTGLNPADPTVAYIYQGIRMKNGSSAFYRGPRPTTDTYVWDVMKNMYLWYNTRMASFIASLKSATDVFGATLLSRTVIPYFTEIADPANTRQPAPAFIFGGSALGMQGGQFQSVTGRHYNDYWMSIGQAFLGANVLEALAAETFFKTNIAPIPGLWAEPL